MPKVISGVQGARDFATDGKVQTIPEVTNRQGARKQLTLAVEKALEKAKVSDGASAGSANGAVENGKVAITGSSDSGKTSAVSETTVSVGESHQTQEDPNEGVDPEGSAWPEAARKAIAKKHRELRKAKDEAVKVLSDLNAAENWGKSEYARAQAAEDRVKDVEKQLADLKAKAPEPPKVTRVKPDPKDFYDDKGQFKLAEYTAAVGKFEAEEAVAKYRTEQEEARTKAEKEKAEEAKAKAFALAKQRTETQAKEYADWDEVAQSAKPLTLAPALAAYIQMSPYVGHIGYYLMTHSDYANTLTSMNALDAIGELGELCIRWKKKPDEPKKPIEQERQAAPAPIATLPGTGSAGVQTDPSKMSPKELLAHDRAAAVAKRQARHG